MNVTDGSMLPLVKVFTPDGEIHSLFSQNTTTRVQYGAANWLRSTLMCFSRVYGYGKRERMRYCAVRTSNTVVFTRRCIIFLFTWAAICCR